MDCSLLGVDLCVSFSVKALRSALWAQCEEMIMPTIVVVATTRLFFLLSTWLIIPSFYVSLLQMLFWIVTFQNRQLYPLLSKKASAEATEREKEGGVYDTIQHFSHSHSLILHQTNKRKFGIVVCSICWEIVLGPSYGSAECNYFLHTGCAKLPREIKHPIHRRHPLVLLPGDETFRCNLCNELCQTFFYHCSLCNFSIDIGCPEVPNINIGECHEHRFSLLYKQISITCDACGEGGEYYPYMCTLCHLTVHKECMSFPRTIRITRHYHPIRHTYFLYQGESYQPCRICLKQVSAYHGCYYCSTCDFVAHSKCATRDGIWDGTIVLLEDEGKDLEDEGKYLCKSLFDWETSMQIRVGENVITSEINHSSHKHSLAFCDEVKGDIYCNGCMLPISTPFYCCARCSFFLHRACGELPWKKFHPSHQHQLILGLSDESILICCNACSLWFHGLFYNCEPCDFYLDPRCASLSDTLAHSSHEHALLASFNENAAACSACGHCTTNFFICVNCNYILDFKCAMLPQTAVDKHDKHLLTLTYQDDFDEHLCLICEEARDPKHWFYFSEICGFEAHVDCVMGKYPYVKLGTTCSIGSHPHSLTLVQKSRNYPQCNSCNKPCKELALECPRPECNFIIHWECREKI